MLTWTSLMALQNLIKRYSEFINFPINLKVTKSVDVEVPIEEGTTQPRVSSLLSARARREGGVLALQGSDWT